MTGQIIHPGWWKHWRMFGLSIYLVRHPVADDPETAAREGLQQLFDAGLFPVPPRKDGNA